MKKVMLTVCAILLSVALVQAQDSEKKDKNTSKKEKIHIEIKDDQHPDIYVDGKKYDFSLDLLDPDQIESVTVVKGDKAMREYKSKNGVVLVKTKQNKFKEEIIDVDKVKTKIKIKSKKEGKQSPVIIINGKVSTREVLEKLNPDEIETIDVYKGEKAIEKYEAPNGAVVVKTKKKKMK